MNSINQIAKELKVSKSTVSKIINGKAREARISEALEKRVLDYVEKVNFKPNSLARSLATGKSLTIGLIVEDIGDSFFGPMALYIEDQLKSQGYHVLYSSTLGNPIEAKVIMQSMIDKKIEGLIIAPTLDLSNQIKELQELKFPLIIFDRNIDDNQANFIGTTNYGSSKLLCEHLLKNQYKNTGFITIDSEQSQMKDRREAYVDFARENGMQENILSIPYETHKTDAIKSIEKWLLANPTVDSLYFSTNYLCISGLKVLRKNKLNIQNYGIVCFDDHESFDIIFPSITCMEQPLEAMSKEIVKYLLLQIKGKDILSDQIEIPATLIVRESSK
ncbi:LacI family DNA-binding transcriptional regulator [Sphingobacterium hungaricum]|uniref:HTH lacI-type domain-containing protein n=1 Tax=Sphingobacterium hungaricum TaxID=2082723 RepID=A0A928USN8_9SPHI|nr:LacI family DNA-binding transcriptional regulator [Sphingobacterium hungaricum]MBE8712480.1 hypothetical protein [Sphingobacterium hungaricum]